jgi:hypothetical protein
MAFQDVPLVEDIARNHLSRVGRLESKHTKILIGEYRKLRNSLRDRLDYFPEDSFTAQKIRGILIQVEAVLAEMESSLLNFMLGSSDETAMLAIQDLVNEARKYEKHFRGAVQPIDLDVGLIAANTRNYLYNKYEASLRAYSAGLRSQIAAGLTQAALEKAPYSRVIHMLGRFFMQEEWKLHRIVRTEIHSIYNMAKQNAMFQLKEKFIPDLKKALFHPMDDRTGEDSKQADRMNLIVDIEKPFSYTYIRYRKDGSRVEEERVFMTPPDRPNDRSIMIPYRDEWK